MKDLISQYRAILGKTTTGDTYKSALVRLEQWYETRNGKLLSNDIVEYSDWLREAGLAESTVRLYVSVFRKLLEWATAYDMVEGALFSKLEVNYKHGGKKRFYYRRPPINADELEMILDYYAVPRQPKAGETPLDRIRRLVFNRDSALIYTLAGTGLRISEALSLRREPFEAFLGGWNGKSTFIHQVIGKGNKARDVLFFPMLLRKIDTYLQQRASDGKPWLFVSHGNQHTKSGKMERGFANKTMDRVSKELGIKGQVRGPHDFRHLFGDGMAERGVSLEMRQAILGHTNADTTNKVYSPQSKTNAMVKEIKDAVGKEWE